MAIAIAGLWNLQDLDIPLDVSHRIVSLLQVRDVCSLSSCSRQWRSSDFTWCIFYQQRWRLNPKTFRQEGSPKSDHLSIADRAAIKGWRAEYIYVHKQMANGATSVIEHGKDVREALSNRNAGEKQVCLRWWSLGGWTNGFRRHDEMHIRITSLNDLTEIGRMHLLEVIDRGTLHEVLRVQISADFKSSAWIARSMHSQR